MVELILSHQT